MRLLVAASFVLGFTNTSLGSWSECSTSKSVGAPTATDVTGSGSLMVVVNIGRR